MTRRLIILTLLSLAMGLNIVGTIGLRRTTARLETEIARINCRVVRPGASQIVINPGEQCLYIRVDLPAAAPEPKI